MVKQSLSALDLAAVGIYTVRDIEAQPEVASGRIMITDRTSLAISALLGNKSASSSYFQGPSHISPPGVARGWSTSRVYGLNICCYTASQHQLKTEVAIETITIGPPYLMSLLLNT